MECKYDLRYLSDKIINTTKEDIGKNFKDDTDLQVFEFANAVVASRKAGGPGVFAQEGFIKESDFNNCVSEIRQFREREISYVQEEVVFIGTLASVYGHMITDNLKHLWIMLSNNKYKGLKFVYVQYDEKSLSDIFFQICEMLGKPRSEIERVDGANRYSKVYIPQQCFFSKPGGLYNHSGDRFYTTEYKQIIEQIKKAVPENKTSGKVYFTRTSLTMYRFRDFGEHYIENTFRELGYRIVSPEKISFCEQVSLLKNCECFATTQGSISINSIFCNENTTVILINKQGFNDPYQLAINQARGGKHVLIDSNLSFLNPRKEPWDGPFFMYSSKRLCEFAGTKYEGIPVITLLQYCFWGILKRAKALINKMK